MDDLERREITYAQSDDVLARNAPKRLVEAYGTEVAPIIGYTPIADFDQVVKAVGGRVHYASPFDFAEEDATILVHGPEDFDIILNVLGHWRRNRFTLAHELGHYFLHSEMGQKPMRAARNQASMRIEWEANWFAAGFLMPENRITEFIREGLTTTVIADRFRVSRAAVEVRRKSLGI